jgi:hypothetical protein
MEAFLMERIAVPEVALIVVGSQRIRKGKAQYTELHNQWHKDGQTQEKIVWMVGRAQSYR